MASITIVSGCPGSGKTTLAVRLANESGQGMHLIADAFYEGLADLAEPGRPALADHEDVVVATARAAGVFAAGGRDVFVDGVLVPRFVPPFVRAVRELDVPIEYLVLRAGLDETLARAQAREDGPPEDVLRRMHAAFADLGPLERHALDSSGQSPDQTVAEIRRRRASGGLRLEPGSLPS